MIQDTIQQLRARSTSSYQYAPPSDADIAGAELALGTVFPLDYLAFLRDGHDLSVWTYKISPNGSWDYRHDIVAGNKSRWGPRGVEKGRHVLFAATGADGGYDAFEVPQGTTVRPDHCPIAHLVFTRQGIAAARTFDSFAEWLRVTHLERAE